MCIGQEISINREGDWFYNKSIIKNKKLVNLFSTVLRKDEENYFLVTPTEKVPVKVKEYTNNISCILLQNKV